MFETALLHWSFKNNRHWTFQVKNKKGDNFQIEIPQQVLGDKNKMTEEEMMIRKESLEKILMIDR